MPARLKLYNQSLKSLQKQHEINPTWKTRADITRIEARIQNHKNQKRAKQKAKRIDTPIASPTVTNGKSAAQVARHNLINDDKLLTVEAFRAAVDAKIAAVLADDVAQASARRAIDEIHQHVLHEQHVLSAPCNSHTNSPTSSTLPSKIPVPTSIETATATSTDEISVRQGHASSPTNDSPTSPTSASRNSGTASVETATVSNDNTAKTSVEQCI